MVKKNNYAVTFYALVNCTIILTGQDFNCYYVFEHWSFTTFIKERINFMCCKKCSLSHI